MYVPLLVAKKLNFCNALETVRDVLFINSKSHNELSIGIEIIDPE